MRALKLLRLASLGVILVAVLATGRTLKAAYVDCELGTGNPVTKGAFYHGSEVECSESWTYDICDYACYECYGGTVYEDGVIACLEGDEVACDCSAIDPN